MWGDDLREKDIAEISGSCDEEKIKL